MIWSDGITDSLDMSLSKLRETVKDREAWLASSPWVGKIPWRREWLPTPEDFVGGASGKEPACQRRSRKRHEFDPWVGKIPWRRKWQPTPVFSLGESHGQSSLLG